MAGFIENPRRTPRIRVNCNARFALRSGGFFVASTADLGPGGCGVVSAPYQMTTGELAFFELEHEGERHRFTGRVAWSSSEPPWRAGIAFDVTSRAAAAALFGRIASASPVAIRAIERIPEDAVLARTPAPGTVTAIPREAEILLAIGAGVEARSLRDRLGQDWGRYSNVLFALLERGAIEARQPASSVEPSSR
jgi:hypothetical protein